MAENGDDSNQQYNEQHGTQPIAIVENTPKLIAPAKLSDIKDWPRWERQMNDFLIASGLNNHLNIGKTNEFDTNEFNLWLQRMPDYEKLSDLQKQILKPFYESTQLSNNQADPRNEVICRNRISSSISKELYSIIQEATTAYDMWNSLKKHCEGESNGQKTILRQNFHDLKLDSKVTMEKFMSQYRDLICDMDRLGIKPSDYEQNEKLLRVLPMGTYRDFVVTHRYQADKLSPSDLLRLIRSEAERLNNWTVSHSKKMAFFNGTRNHNGRGRGRGRGQSNGRVRGPNNQQTSQQNTSSEIVCYRCWEDSHKCNECPNAAKPAPIKYQHFADKSVYKRLSVLATKSNNGSRVAHFSALAFLKTPNGIQSNLSTLHSADRSLAYSNMETHNSFCPTHDLCQALAIDSGASDHLISNSSLFDEIHTLPTLTTVTASSEEIVSSQGGTARLKIQNSDGSELVLTLSNAYYMPELPVNLFSTTRFIERSGGSCVLTPDGANLLDEHGNLIFDATIQHGIPMAHVLPTQDSYSYAFPTINQAHLWHSRLGHIDIRKINAMQAKQIVQPFDYAPISPAHFQFCEACPQSKITRQPFSKTHKERSSVAGELIFTDLCGPFRVKSKQGSKYLQVTIDSYSRYIIVNGLSTKSQHPKLLQSLIYLLQTQHTWQLKTVRSDDAGELRSHKFTEFLRSLGIQLISSIADAHEQNTLAERAIRTIVEGGRVMLHISGLPQSFWEYAMRFMTHVYNLTMHSKTTYTPYQLFYGGQVPSINHLRVFGSHCIVKSRTRHLNKLSPKGFPARLIGYNIDKLGSSPNGYIIYNPSSKKVSLARDLIFNEQPVLDACHRFSHSYVYPSLESGGDDGDDTDADKHSSLDSSEDSSSGSESNDIEDDMSTKQHGHVDATQDSANDRQKSTLDYILNELSSDEGYITAEENQLPEEEAVENLFSDAEEVDQPIASRTRQQLRQLSLFSLHLVSLLTSTHPIKWTLFAFACAFTLFDQAPRSYKEAMRRPDAKHWKEAILAERESLEKADAYMIWDRPVNVSVLPFTGVFKIKQNSDGSIERYKFRLCVRGDKQIYGIHFEDTFSPVVKFSTIKLVLALATIMDWDTRQLDIDVAFTYGRCDTDIYMEIPPYFYPDAVKKGQVFKLLSALYGTRQGSSRFNEVLDEYLTSLGFSKSSLDMCCYVKFVEISIIIVLVYIDDIIYVSDSAILLDQFYLDMTRRFSLKDLGALEFVVGIRVKRQINSTTMDQSLYHHDMLDRFNMFSSIPAKSPLPAKKILYPASNDTDLLEDPTTYRSQVGSLMYSMMGTRPDLSFAVSQLSRHLHAPTKVHLDCCHQTLRYLLHTEHQGLKFTYNGKNDSTSRRSAVKLVAYSDADWAGDISDSKSTRGHIICLANAPIIHSCNKIQQLCKSSTAAETAAADACNDDIYWARSMLEFLGFKQEEPTTLYMDNEPAMRGIKRGNTTQANKYFRVRIDSLHQSVKSKEIVLKHMNSSELPADMLTKSLSGPALLKHKTKLNVGDVNLNTASTSGDVLQ